MRRGKEEDWELVMVPDNISPPAAIMGEFGWEKVMLLPLGLE